MKYFYIFFISILIITGCKNQSETKPVGFKKHFTSTLTNKDTTDVIGLSSLCLQVMKSDIDSALNYIYYIKNDTLLPLSETKRDFLKKSFLCNIKDYTLDTLVFSTEFDNMIKYKIIIDNDQKHPFTQKFTFNPIKIETAWYLTLKE